MQPSYRFGSPIFELKTEEVDQPMTGVYAMWSSVLKLSIRDAMTDCQQRRHALAWIASDAYQPGSFLWLCHHIGIDEIGQIREMVQTGNWETLSLKQRSLFYG
jgi:hypothetical protein